MKGRFRTKARGITLIALVVTIVVLLILAGVSIAMLTGENGILTQAQNSKEITEIEEIKERAQLDILGVKAGDSGKITEEEINEILEKYGVISGEGENKVITTEKGYVIKVQDIYSGELAIGESGKNITELYNGINDPEDEDYDENAMHIGDYVDYDAGKWTETVTIPQEGNRTQYRLKFGGYMQGQSRNTNATGMYDYWNSQIDLGNKEGWRIWDISEDKKTITIISAGCPETFLFEVPNEWDEYKYNYEKILTGSTQGDIIESVPNEPRIWNMYINSRQYATNARTVTKEDMDNWYKKYIDNSVQDSSNVELSHNTDNKIISTFINGSYYWIATIGDEWNGVYYMDPIENKLKKRNVDFLMPYNYGIRVLITLSTDVKFNETPQKVEGDVHDGFVYNKWEICQED